MVDDWRPVDDGRDHPWGVKVTALGFALALLATVLVCCFGVYAIGADAWEMLVDVFEPTD